MNDRSIQFSKLKTQLSQGTHTVLFCQSHLFPESSGSTAPCHTAITGISRLRCHLGLAGSGKDWSRWSTDAESTPAQGSRASGADLRSEGLLPWQTPVLRLHTHTTDVS